AEHENVSQEVAGDQDKDDAQETVMAALATQKTEVPLQKNEVKTLRNVDHSSAIRADVKSGVPIVVKEYIGTSRDDALHKALQRHITELIKMEQAGKQQEPKYTIVSSDMDALLEFDQKRTLFETMTKTKSFERNSKHKALYHALMESILEDEDAMDKGLVQETIKTSYSKSLVE
ncbi:hypothetical protein Tco_0050047, partial [Tanacetum coccineum]